MNFWNWAAGMMEAELLSADLWETLQQINAAGIPVFAVNSTDELTAHFAIYRRDAAGLRSICQRRGDRLTLHESRGFYRLLRSALHRPVLTAGLALILLATAVLPTRVFFVRVEGNTRVPARQILAAAEENGIGFGCLRREIRSEKVKNALLSAIPELQWAGVNTSGCTAVISVRERSQETAQTKASGVSSIVAARDGVITSVTVLRGSAACAVGQAVKQNQVLISGYTDCGLCIQVCRAEGEVFAQTRRNLTLIMPMQYRAREEVLRVQRKGSLLLGKKRINFCNTSGNPTPTCGKLYTENYLTLPGGFRLPIGLAWETYTDYAMSEETLSPETAQQLLKQQGTVCLLGQMAAGSILHRQEIFAQGADFYQLTGQYSCLEMIGREHPE